MPETMSDKGRHALDKGADARSTNANWDAEILGVCTGDKGIAFLTQPGTQRTPHTQHTQFHELFTQPSWAGYGRVDLWGSSPARRVDFSRQTARFRLWNTPLSAPLGVCNADSTGDATNATDATGTQRLPRPRGGTTPRAGQPVRLFSRTPAGRTRRDKTCLGDEGEDATEFPIRNHSFTPPRTYGTSHRTRRRSVCVPRLV